MSELLPCCQCGEAKGYDLSEGSTYRWWLVHCKSCGGDFGECAADRVTNLHKDPLPERWQWADEHWNDTNAHAQGLRDRIAALERVAEAANKLWWLEYDYMSPLHEALREAGYLKDQG